MTQLIIEYVSLEKKFPLEKKRSFLGYASPLMPTGIFRPSDLSQRRESTYTAGTCQNQDF